MRQKNKILSLIIVLFMLFSMTLNVFAQISDIDSHWGREEINYMLDKGVLSGYPDGTFRPNNNISKVEFYKIINQLLGYEDIADVGFKDVVSTEWFYKEVAKGIKAGYLLNGEFLNPKDFITREEVARIIGFSFKLKENPQSASFFKDHALISPSAIGFIGALKEKEYISGFPDGSFGPQNNITRAEVVKMLYNILIAEGLPKKVDLTAYKAALAAVKKSDYTAKSWNTYQKIVEANKVTEDNTQDEVDAATSAIKAAQKDLVKEQAKASGGGGGSGDYEPPKKADLSRYKAVLAAVKKADYTEESWAIYQKVVEDNKVTEKDTQARVDAATAKIKAAQEKLVRIEEPGKVDKTKLTSSIQAAAVYEAVYYTPETWEDFKIALENAKEVRDNDQATQAEVDEALAALIEAIESLEEVDPEPVVDKTELAAKIAEARGLNEENYTEESWLALESVLAEAVAVNEDEEATQAEVEEALAALIEAIEGLEEKEEPAITNIQPTEDITLKAGDTLEISFNAPTGGDGYYRIMIPLYTKLDNKIGTPMYEESPGLYTAIWTVPEKLEATGLQVEVIYITTDGGRLCEIAEGKITVILEEEPVVDKSELAAKIAEAEGLDEEDYTEESWSNLQIALGTAINVRDNEEATQAEVEETLAALAKAIEALEEKEEPVVDKSELIAKIAEAESLNEEDYTEESWSNLQIALEAAINIRDSEEATQIEVNEALAALVNAIAALVRVEQSVEEALAEAIAEAEQLNKNTYRPETWVDLWKALKNAKVAYSNPASTEEQLSEVLERLLNAMDALLEKNIAPEEATIMATYHPSFIPTFGTVSIQVTNIESAAKFTVVYHLADDKDTGRENLEKTAIADIGQKSGNIFYNIAQYNTVEISIYDVAGEYICTFESVVLGRQ
ncbi:S-layer homology domain-containing protein [Proteiniborus sp. MB09-C3]|uniref:S-layer homology domain-containing protein n=1 Tax=Proteiniborus sp. MB09-C3 TaxID=3050072 RepID=UPI002554262C|nr:S-layer homology domain-containing protein [Proteiniborus sp. MB09-C3]WIV12984.1 S-layer homology domain-containing protein [Proteiniborus sp. MB09-C3]